MPKENNKMQVDIDTLKKQNVNDLLSIKEIYSKLEEVEEKISQIKYIDNTLVKKLKKEYRNLKKIILDENIQIELSNKINEIIPQMETNKKEIRLTTNNIESRCINVKYPPKGIVGAKGDGKTDDTQTLKNIFALLNDGDTLYFPKGNYKTTDTLTITRAINLEMKGCIVGHHSKTILLLKNDEPKGNFSNNTNEKYIMNCEFNISRDLVNGDKKNSNSIGIEIWNAYFPRFTFKKVINNYIGVKLKAEKYGSGYAGVTYGCFFIGLLDSYYCNLLCETGNDGYITQNQFYGGSFTGGDSKIENMHIYLNNIGNSVINENTFIGTSLEGAMTTGVKAYNVTSNKFISTRYEMPHGTKAIHLIDSRFNEFTNSEYLANFIQNDKYQIEMSSSKVNDCNLIEYIDYRIGHIKYYDGVFYITPNKNRNGVYNSNLSTVIPDSWDINVLYDGYTDNFIYANDKNVTDGSMNIKLSQHTKYTISTQVTVNKLVFTKPPKTTKEFIIDFRNGTLNDTTLSKDSTITSLIDTTGNNCIIPKGIKFIKLLYRYFNNELYILNIY